MPEHPDRRDMPSGSPKPTTLATHARVPARVTSIRAIALVVLLVATAVVSPVAAGSGADTASADVGVGGAAGATAPAGTVPALDAEWFLLGANVPFLSWRCDFGCGPAGGGVRGREAEVDAMLRSLGARGVHTVRWYLFPGDAWQVRRAPGGRPTGLSRAALLDLDLAVSLARKHDIYLVPVLFPSPRSIPRTWFTSAIHRSALARELGPLFRRYADDPHLLAWELLTVPEELIDTSRITAGQARSLALHLRVAVDRAGSTKSTVGALDITRLDTWTGIGLDFLAPQGLSTQTGARCVTCTATTTLAANDGVTEPVIVGAIDSASQEAAANQLRRLRARGYAGAWFWSWRGVTHPLLGAGHPTVPLTTTWFHGYANPNSGPRSRPLNHCIGPRVAEFLCPNLRMSRPSNLFTGSRGGRRVLFSTNSLDSVGVGPASLKGRRDGHRTMAAKQVLKTRRGGKVLVDTGAKLLFKAIPGQSRYWKWNGAAQMELWRIDGLGRPIERARMGPKTVYCLRDLKRTRGYLRGSPRSAAFPGCSQDPDARERTLGTSVGWSDVYPATYYENWIDVTGLRGCFSYVHVADPTNVIYESNEEDNRSAVVVRLPYTGSSAGCHGSRPIPGTGSNGGY